MPRVYNKKEKIAIHLQLTLGLPLLVIKNEKPPERKTTHFLEINSLGHITSDKNGKIIRERTTSRDECIRNILSFFELWKREQKR